MSVCTRGLRGLLRRGGASDTSVDDDVIKDTPLSSVPWEEINKVVLQGLPTFSVAETVDKATQCTVEPTLSQQQLVAPVLPSSPTEPPPLPATLHESQHTSVVSTIQRDVTVAFAHPLSPAEHVTSSESTSSSDSTSLLQLPSLRSSISSIRRSVSSELKLSAMVPLSSYNFTEFQYQCLVSHNEFRHRHGVPPLSLNMEMCNHADDVATALTGNTPLPPPPDRKYGELVLVTKGSVPVSAQETCLRWYSQCQSFVYGVEPRTAKSRKDTKCFFTQMIWKKTRELGIGVSCAGGVCAVVALYHPPGNITGEFVDNCPSPLLR